MPTIKDIAKAANVSHGTVSNVLNKKGNVSAKKIELVESIALEMGYNINRNAKQLRLGISKHIDIVIPDGEIRRYRDLYKTISKYAEEAGFSYNIYISDEVPHKEKEIIKSILSNRVHTVVIISCLDNSDNFYSTLNFGSSNLIFVERKVPCKSENAFYYSYSAEGIGKNIAGYIKSQNYKKILYFSSRKIYSFENDIYQVLFDRFNDSKYSLSQYSCDTSLNIQTSFRIVFSENEFDVIVTTSKEKAKIIKDIIDLSGINENVEIITLASTDILQYSTFTELELNYKQLGKMISKNIKSANEDKNNILNPPVLSVDDCSLKKTEKEINIACIEGISEDALRDVSKLIYSSTGIKANIRSYKYNRLFELLKNDDLNEDFDIIRIDMAWLTSFGKEIFIPLNEINYNFDNIFSNFMEGLEEEYSQIDGKRYAFPFDPSILLLFYRKDLFENTKLSRMYFEKYKTELKPPQNFEEYIQITSFFTKTINSESITTYGTTCITSSPQHIACQFLPIYYSLGGKISKKKKPYLNYELLKKAIEINLESFKYAHTSSESVWGDSISWFASGEAAMSISFSNRTSNVINSKISNILGKFSFQTLPGEKQLIGGGVLGIYNKTSNIETVCNFLEQFYSKKISTIFACLCGASSSKYVYANEDISDIYPWMKYVQENLKKGKRRFIGEEFNELDFEYNLGSSLKELFNDDCSIDECIFNILNMKSAENLHH
jgi:multiple sugar transport system substrate-binding protein